jgi:segregation and condensation protein A
MDGLIDLEYSGTTEGSGNIPLLDLEGFAGPLDFLLRMARDQKINLAALPILDIVQQLAEAVERAPAQMPLGQKADWVVMASWILLLRSNLILPEPTPEQREAEIVGSELRDRLLALQEVQALANWLDRRPVLGRDVFVRGQPEWAGQGEVAYRQKVDVIAFLWAAMDLFDDPAEKSDQGSLFRPAVAPYSVPEAQERIVRLLAEGTGSRTLDQLLPEDTRSKAVSPQRRRAAWSTTFVASLELAKQGEAVLSQEVFMGPIHARGVVQIDGCAELESLAIAG